MKMREPARGKVSFWRLGLGLLLIFIALKNFDTGNIQPDLMPSNQTQWLGYYAVTLVFLIGGLVLVFFGIHKLWHKPPQS
jgi:uncharacterized membrane protein